MKAATRKLPQCNNFRAVSQRLCQLPSNTMLSQHAPDPPHSPKGLAVQVKIVKKDYTPFPPPQQPSKEDLAIESGEYFLSEEQRQGKQQARAQAQREARQAAKSAAREAAFVAPKAPKQPQVSSLVLARQIDGHAYSQAA